MTKRKPKFPSDSEIIDLLNKNVLVSHAVTLSTDEYIKKSARDFLTSYVLQHLNIVVVNKDPKNLETSMLFSSFPADDLTMLLHGCVSSTSGFTITETNKEVDIEQKKRKELEKMLHVCSLEEIIEHVEKSMGQPRILYFEKPPESTLDELKKMLSAGISTASNFNKYKTTIIGSFIRVTKPAEIDYTKLNFVNIQTSEALDIFLKEIIQYESGMSDTLDISIELFEPSVGKVFSKMPDWEELAIKEAKSSSYNNISFDVVKDPWAALFNGL